MTTFRRSLIVVAALTVGAVAASRLCDGVAAWSNQAGQVQKAGAKKNPLVKLIEPWPDAEAMKARRASAENRALFRSADPIALTLAADFKSIKKDRDPESTKRFPGTVTLKDNGGQENRIPVELGTRGAFRLDARNCEFVPLRIDFARPEDLKGTPFDGQKSLKLVTHCRSDRTYEQYIVREYLTYRIYNLLTPRSYRARLASVTYVDQVSAKPIETRTAMFIEAEDDVAHRNDTRVIDLPRAEFKNLDADSLTLMMLFQYMIGNTDFSIYALHNVRLLQDQKKIFYPVSFDFDLSGLVWTQYSGVSPKLPIASVRERMYRGPCRTAAELEPSAEVFRSKKDAIFALYDTEQGIDEPARRDAKRFLQEFYAIIEKPDQIKRKLVDGCQKISTM